jgi:hypothetical protein
MLAPKFLYIRDLFQKDDNNLYTKEALLYQNILEFPLKTNSNSDEFKFWDLGPWLIKNNKEFREAFGRDKHSSKANTTITYAVLKKKDRMEKKLEDLIRLGLLYQSGWTRSEKVKDHVVPLYSHTGAGYFVSQLIEWDDPDKRKNASDILFRLLQSILGTSSSSMLEFLSKIYSAYRDKGLFDKAIDVLKHELSHNFKHIGEFNGQEMIRLALITVSSCSYYLEDEFEEIYFHTFNSLDEKTRHNLIFFEKMSNQQLLFGTYPSKEWEELCIKNFSDNSKTAAIAWCSNCKKKEPVVVDIPQRIHLGPILTDNIACKKCNRNNLSILIQSIDDLYDFTIPNKRELKELQSQVTVG